MNVIGVYVYCTYFCMAGRGRRLGPLLLAAAGGHDDVAAGVQGRRREPRLGGRRRDGRGHGRRVRRVPASRRHPLRPPPPPPCAAGTYVHARRRCHKKKPSTEIN